MGFKLFFCSFCILSYLFREIYSYNISHLNPFNLFPSIRINKLYNSCQSKVKDSCFKVSKESQFRRGSSLDAHGNSTLDPNLQNSQSNGVDLIAKYKLLSQVNNVSDLKRVPPEMLPQLCNEIRVFLGDVISKVGGHFSGSLGVTELTVALHYVFDSPFDKIIWDIGHQAYVHKMLTGRRDRLCTIKRKGGLSGFCRIYESVHDIFGAGHSSTSISSLQGILEGHLLSDSSPDKNLNKDQEHGNEGSRVFLCVIGDGGMTGGLAYESLNYAINIKSPLVVVYNDNKQVSLPTGMNSIIGTKPVLPFFLEDSANKPVISAKEAVDELLKKLDKGEEGLKVIGPIDGHNLDDLLYLFRLLKYPERNSSCQEKNEGELDKKSIYIKGRRINGPLIIHIKTVKGYCCPEALNQLDRMHAIKPNTNLTIVNPEDSSPKFNIENDCSSLSSTPDGTVKVEWKESDYSKFDTGSFSEVFANTLIKMAGVDNKIVAVTAAMPGGTGVGRFGDFFPNRTFDVGICEQHAVTFSGGLSLSGVKPYCALYSTFLQRGFDQVIHDIVIQNLPVKFIIDRAGYVGEDGLSHHGNYDLNLLRVFKNVVTMVPSNQIELALMLRLSSGLKGPCAIRYPKDKVPSPSLLTYYHPQLYEHIKYYRYLPDGNVTNSHVEATNHDDLTEDSSPELWTTEEESKLAYAEVWDEIQGFRSKVVRRGSEVAILCLGPILYEVIQAVDSLGIRATVVDMRFLNPLDVSVLNQLESDHKFLITAEESVSGGLGTAVLEYLADSDKLSKFKVKCIRYPYEFIHHATREQQKESAHIDSKGIESQIREFLKG